MGSRPSNNGNAGRLFGYSQIGLEMVAPIVLGLYLDEQLGWSPWGVVAGAVLGLVGGLTHLVVLTREPEANDSSSQPDGK
jgi:F0F1-type ATP synthase assembly protein I